MNSRRRLIIALGAGSLMAPFAARAQQPGKVWRIGILSFFSGPNGTIDAFREGLRSLGYIEGGNVLIEYRWAAGKNERLTEMAAELVRLKVDVIVTQASFPVTAAKLATSAIPIVMTAANDPLGSGLVASLARPGGNVTGLSMQSTDLAGKHLQLLRELAPKATRVAVLTQTGQTSTLFIEQLQAAAKRMGISLVTQQLNETEALASAFAALQRTRTQALIVPTNTFTSENSRRIVALVAQHRLPAIYGS
ncbi:MAG: hypothetical protein EXR27_04065 [Betaproteobacteria bacterium]|nr:hypothetical protein [Betaproteobacteria bacterium]